MYATIRRYDDAGFARRLAERRDDVGEALSTIPGFRAYYLLATAGGTISVSVYDDEQGAQQSTETARSWLRENMPDAPAPSDVSAGEVLVSF